MIQLGYFILFSVLLPSYFVQTQVENLALNKPTNSTQYGSQKPSFAVDGSLSQVYENCGNTVFQPKQTVAWWQVDLTHTAQIMNITIYNRQNTGSFLAVRRLNGFQITIGMDNVWQDEQPCFNDTEPGYPPNIITIDTCTGPGRYVTIFNYQYDDADSAFGPMLELCEIQVFGCTPNKYGTDCKLDCHCTQKGCYRGDGRCFVPRCETGWHGTSCNKVCDGNTFGLGCASTCNCQEGTCSHTTGVCYKEGCQAGWKGLTCSTPCDTSQNKFARDCNYTCHCLQGSCNRTNGVCNILGCNAGWEGPSCSTPCKTDNFGEDCKFTCHCLTGSCPHDTGRCNGDCDPGWLTETCSKPCVSNTFGKGCKTTCHCNQGTCKNTNGRCFTQGCKSGWKGYSCSTSCSENKFGTDCNETCHCLNGTCDRFHGTCSIPGCEPGYQRRSCNKRCNKGYFGSNCSSKCYCKTDTCHHITGKCSDLMCKDGWKGNTCSKKCENGTYGSSCTGECHCLVGTCNNENGQCDVSGCKDGWTGNTCSEKIQQEMNTIIGVLVGGLCLILIAALITIYICRRRRSTNGKKSVNAQQSKPDDELDHVYQELDSHEQTAGDYSVIKSDRIEETSYVNSAFSTTVLRLENIRDDIAKMIKNGILQKQYKNIPCGPLHPQTAGNLTKNKKKNRNPNVIPYDTSRVILNTSGEGQDADDYINASYIKGLTKDSMYIATQGPMKNTVEDFWRMVWQTKSSMIVMLNNATEDKQDVCFQYWPLSSSVSSFLEYEIVLLEEQTRSEFITRKLKVENTKTGEVRKVWHLQFTSWPRQGVPIPYQLLLLHRKYSEIHSNNDSGPAIIHCSDGTDRTGVFIALDAVSQCCYRNDAIDICMFVTEMRKNRINMVATEFDDYDIKHDDLKMYEPKESYTLVHKLLLEDLQFERTHTITDDFLTTIQEGGYKIDHEYEMLVNNIPEYDDTFYKESMMKKNKGKNRNQCVLPVDTYRVVLNKAGGSQYINAVTIPSCRISKQFLVTQIPMSNTVVDLWKMILQYNSCTIINLEDAPSFEKDLIWHPTDDNKLVLGNLTLTKSSESMTTQGTKAIGLKILDKETNNDKLIKLYRYLNWRPAFATPSPQTSFLDLVRLVLSWNKSINNGPITVICSDGAKCCGLFCLVYSIIENLSYSDDIDIYQMARLQQIRRPQFFSLDQYRFCYNIVQEYLGNVQLYNDIE